LARVLLASVRTIRSDIATLKAEGYAVSTRGMLQGAGHRDPLWGQKGAQTAVGARWRYRGFPGGL
ncbi:MAG: hypothetical protein P8169_07285, partial [Chloroflexota bacterium]